MVEQTQHQTVDALDRRIIGALQVDGRASWRRIAAALDEPERTVARHGARLLEQRVVVVTGLGVRGGAVLVRGQCLQAAARVAAGALARHPDTTFAYMLTGAADCLAEVMCPAGRLATLTLDELPGIPGLVQSTTLPVLRYFRTVHDWQPGILTAAEADAVREYPPLTPLPTDDRVAGLGREERTMLRALALDGRRTHEEIARIAGVSEPTARRRVDWMRRTGALHIRAVVDPAVIGLPVQAILWVKATPAKVEAVGEALLVSPLVRYVAAVMGEHQIVVDVTVPDRTALYEFVTRAPWVRHTEAIETSLVIRTLKRSGVLSDAAPEFA
ncbi:Lrp/AsnC family transcriptional regulator [Yinghuangia soli]|uniref:Lrp/AsnC family transcriptional regulator n=1 Tax=Yinghuangia soli TaxID=2908204 RepID=A0AA41Q013_9ACTN|nr:Lrp/AsnC family transcriptional regulator [Yinghuangia soli]MCF2527934.1 Lrp/AsnC family transcriptional regulator [Yinghuangia soli]